MSDGHATPWVVSFTYSRRISAEIVAFVSHRFTDSNYSWWLAVGPLGQAGATVSRGEALTLPAAMHAVEWAAETMLLASSPATDPAPFSVDLPISDAKEAQP